MTFYEKGGCKVYVLSHAMGGKLYDLLRERGCKVYVLLRTTGGKLYDLLTKKGGGCRIYVL